MPIGGAFFAHSRNLTLFDAVIAPFTYWLAITLLPPFDRLGSAAQTTVAFLRSALAIIAALLFFRLPLQFHVSGSLGLTYILSLVGYYGGARVLDLFFLTTDVPRRILRKHKPIIVDSDASDINDDKALDSPFESDEDRLLLERSRHEQKQLRLARRRSSAASDSRPFQPKLKKRVRRNSLLNQATAVMFSPTKGEPHIEKAYTETIMGLNLKARALYALDLMLAMRGVGWTWTSADVRHTKKTWLPSIVDEIRQLTLSDMPNVFFSWLAARFIYKQIDPEIGFESLSLPNRYLLTLAQGFFLFGTFSLGYNMFAVATWPLRNAKYTYSKTNLAFFPALNTQSLYTVTSVRKFWNSGWHRLFSRFFLVWGTLPGQCLQRLLVPHHINDRYDAKLLFGKVIGAFFISGVIHTAASLAINGNKWREAGEFKFFVLCGIAVVFEEIFKMMYKPLHSGPTRWYERLIGQTWTVTVLLSAGQYFTKGWVDSGLIGEMTRSPSEQAHMMQATFKSVFAQ